MEKKQVTNSFYSCCCLVLLGLEGNNRVVWRSPRDPVAECSSSWSKAGGFATWAGRFSADMRSPTSASAAYTSAQCSADSRAAASWWVRNQRLSGGWETAIDQATGIPQFTGNLLLYMHSNICRAFSLIINEPFHCTVALTFTLSAILAYRAVQAIGCFCSFISHGCGFLVDSKLSFENHWPVTAWSTDVLQLSLAGTCLGWKMTGESTCALLGLQCQ